MPTEYKQKQGTPSAQTACSQSASEAPWLQLPAHLPAQACPQQQGRTQKTARGQLPSLLLVSLCCTDGCSVLVAVAAAALLDTGHLHLCLPAPVRLSEHTHTHTHRLIAKVLDSQQMRSQICCCSHSPAGSSSIPERQIGQQGTPHHTMPQTPACAVDFALSTLRPMHYGCLLTQIVRGFCISVRFPRLITTHLQRQARIDLSHSFRHDALPHPPGEKQHAEQWLWGQHDKQ